jgi:hypothetical protein
MPDRSTCRSCGAAILWVVTHPGGKRMPLDVPPVKRFVVEDGEAYQRDTYVSHFATCPNAAQHRKKPEAGR